MIPVHRQAYTLRHYLFIAHLFISHAANDVVVRTGLVTEEDRPTTVGPRERILRQTYIHTGSVVVKDLRLKNKDKDKESSFKDKDKDKDLISKDDDRDEDLKIGARGSSRTRTFLEQEQRNGSQINAQVF